MEMETWKLLELEDIEGSAIQGDLTKTSTVSRKLKIIQVLNKHFIK